MLSENKAISQASNAIIKLQVLLEELGLTSWHTTLDMDEAYCKRILLSLGIIVKHTPGEEL